MWSGRRARKTTSQYGLASPTAVVVVVEVVLVVCMVVVVVKLLTSSVNLCRRKCG